MFYMYGMYNICDGPMCSTLVTSDENCENNSWATLLYMNNIYGSSEEVSRGFVGSVAILRLATNLIFVRRYHSIVSIVSISFVCSVQVGRGIYLTISSSSLLYHSWLVYCTGWYCTSSFVTLNLSHRCLLIF